MDNALLEKLDELECHPHFYERVEISVRLQDESHSMQSDCWCYMLHDFQPNMLKLPFMETYDAFGPHGLEYVPQYLRQPNQGRGHFWHEIKTSVTQTSR